MIIEVNKDYKIEIKEDYLVVKDKKLYNTKTKEFEGVEGDIIEFKFSTGGGKELGYRGYVDGYTSDKFVKIRGVDKVHTNIVSKKVEHISSVTDFTDDTVVKTEVVFSD